MPGKIVVMEGLDGSGKLTQSQILAENLKSKGYNIKLISMPDYNNLSSGPVRLYLEGKISLNIHEINAYAASSFFAVDRYISYMSDWKSFHEKKDSILICDRYTTSNMIYQLAKIAPEFYDEFLEWLCEYEYIKLGIPKPDLVIYLKIPIEISRNLIKIRCKEKHFEKDLHESDEKYLIQCEACAKYLTEKFGWQTLNCSSDGKKIDSIKKISNKVIKVFNKYILF
jgi:dTMP kinase